MPVDQGAADQADGVQPFPELPGLSVASRPFDVGGMVLYQSHVSRQGATYEPLLETPLTG